MEIRLKHRLVGALVLIALIVIFTPFLFKRFLTAPSKFTLLSTHIPNAPSEPDFKQTVLILPNAQGGEQTITLSRDADGDVNASASKMITSTDHLSVIKPVEFKQIGNDAQGKSINIGKAWVVELGTFANSNHAQTLKKQLQSRGFTAYTHTRVSSDGKTLTQVFVGPEVSRAKAESLLTRLDEAMRMKGVIRAFDPLVNDQR